MKNWSNTKKIWIALLVIVAILVIYNWSAISKKLGLGVAFSDSKRSSNPSIQAFKDRAADISARLTTLIDDTNSRLKANGSDGQIYPNASKEIPKGLCKCWSILWGAYGYWSKSCCNNTRMSPDQKLDVILADFKAKASLIEAEGIRLGNDIDATFPSTAREEGGCCCAWIVYAGIGFCVGRHKKSCCVA